MEGGGVENYICAFLIWILGLVRGHLKAGNIPRRLLFRSLYQCGGDGPCVCQWRDFDPDFPAC